MFILSVNMSNEPIQEAFINMHPRNRIFNSMLKKMNSTNVPCTTSNSTKSKQVFGHAIPPKRIGVTQ